VIFFKPLVTFADNFPLFFVEHKEIEEDKKTFFQHLVLNIEME